MDPFQLLNVLYGPASSQDERKNAENQLLNLLKSPQGLLFIPQLLNGDSNAQFFAMMTVQVHLVTTDYRPTLDELFNIYTVVKSSPLYVVHKFALALATLGLKSNPDNFIETVYNKTQSAVLALFTATDVVNESDKIYQNRFKNHSIVFAKNNATFVIQLIQQCLAHDQYIEEATLCFTTWLERFDESQIQLIYNILLDFINKNKLMDSVCDSICGIITAMNRFEKSICDSLLPCICNEKVILLVDNQSESIHFYLKLIIGIGEDMTDYLVKNVFKEHVQFYFQILLKITNTTGVYAIDEDISEEPLFIWTYVQEAVTEPTSHLCKLIAIDMPNYDPSRFEIPTPIYSKFEEIYQALLPILLRKMSVDPLLFRSQPKDIINTFAVYRSSLCDAVQDCYKITPSFTINYLLQLLKNMIMIPTSKEQDLESILRSLSFLSELAEDDASVYRIFDPLLLNQSMHLAQQNTWIPVHAQYLNCIKQFSTWFEKNSSHDPSLVIEYVMTLMQNSRLQSSAINAIKGLCNSLPSHMIAYSGPLLNNLALFNVDIKIGILQALSSTTDALAINEKLSALTLLMKHVNDGLTQQQSPEIMMKWISCFEVIAHNYPLPSEISNESALYPFLLNVDRCLLTTMMCVSLHATNIELSVKFAKIVGFTCPLLQPRPDLEIKSMNELSQFLSQWWSVAPCSECLDSFHTLIKASDIRTDVSLKKVAMTKLVDVLLDSSKFSTLN
eukprot:NODE_75_length_23373_cov_0.434261.p1 type:complete len:730 gc:universal NODE_75_length_23373_cov_0.434261:18780-20969(+)